MSSQYSFSSEDYAVEDFDLNKYMSSFGDMTAQIYNPFNEDGSLKDVNGTPSTGPLGTAASGLIPIIGVPLAFFESGKWGIGIPKKDRAELINGYQNAIATIQAKLIDAAKEAYTTKTQAEASLKAMLLDCDTRLKEKEIDLKIAQTQAETDQLGINKQYEIEKLKAENDAERVRVENRYADAAMISAQASMVKAESYLVKEEGRAYEAKYGTGYGSTAWYTG